MSQHNTTNAQPPTESGVPDVLFSCPESSPNPESFLGARASALDEGGLATSADLLPRFAPAAVKGAKSRALGLFIIRESDESNRELFNAMRLQTYVPYDDIEDVDAVRRVGLLPMTSRRFTLEDGREVFVEVLSRGGTQAYLFRVGDYWHFWSMASATKLGEQGVNEVTDLLREVIVRLRPINVYVHNISRLIRSRAQGALLQAELDQHVDVVWAGEVPFHFAGPMAHAGTMMFSMFAIVASMERDWIVQRLLAGKIAKWRRKEWPLGAGTIPFGYMLDAKTRRLVVDESKRSAVEEMLKVLAYGKTPAQMQRDLDAAGVVGMRKHRRLGTEVPVGTMGNADALINSLYAYASVWCRGEYLYRHANVFKDISELSGVEVIRDDHDESDLGELQMLCGVDLPDGGWASPDLLDAVALAAKRNAARMLARGHKSMRPLSLQVESDSADPGLHDQVLTGARKRSIDTDSRRWQKSRARKQMSPFTGRGWREGSWWYELTGVGRTSYRVVRWPVGDVASAERGERAGTAGGVS